MIQESNQTERETTPNQQQEDLNQRTPGTQNDPNQEEDQNAEEVEDNETETEPTEE